MKRKTKVNTPPQFSHFVYEVRVGGVKATFCLEQDANDYARQIGGTVYPVGAIKQKN